MNKSFTLIELIVTIAILVGLATVGIPAFRRSQADAEIRSSAETVKAAILRTYTYSLASRPEDIKASRYTLTCYNNDQANPQAYRDSCQISVYRENSPSPAEVIGYKFEAGISLNLPSTGIGFNTPNGYTTAPSLTINLKHYNFSNLTKTITFTRGSNQVIIE